MRNNLYVRLRFVSLLTVIATLLCTLFVSCGKAEAEVPTETPDKSICVEFTDALGQNIKITKNPERVAALLGSFADVWMLAGGEICAAAEDAWSDFGLELGGAVNIGGAHSPSLEMLLSSAPDLVLASASTASNVNMKDALISAGVTVVYFDVDNFDDYLKMLEICTRITGREDLYIQNGLNIQSQINSIKEKYEGDSLTDKERTVLLLRVSPSHIRAKGSRGTILGEMLYDMGCINIADSDTSLLDNLSIESIIQEEPYRIFAVAMGGDNKKAQELLDNMIKENPAWATLEAVREGRVHLMDKKLFNLKPNARWGESYQKLYETLTAK